MSEAAVVVDGVWKRFRLYHERNQSLKAALLRKRRSLTEEFWALQDVSLEVPAGTSFGLIGENGSGKSTLMKCMARILRPDSGSISVEGQVSALLELGAGFHPELTGRENVFLNGSILGLRQRDLEAKFDEIVAFAGLEQFIDQPVKNYSSGMYVRLGFSVAVHVDPDVLLVDEVLAVGDEAFQRKCFDKFSSLKNAGKTIVVVSHDLGSVQNLCDRVAWLDHGRVKRVAGARSIVDEYMETLQEGEQPGREEGSKRWGSGEGRVEHVELLDHKGAPVSRVRTGQAVTFRLHYRMEEPIERPVFGVGFHTLDGVYLSGPNTREGGCVPDLLQGGGHVDLHIDRLLLLPGAYDITAVLFDYSCLHPYDFRVQVLRFHVDQGEPRESYGIVSLGGRWELGPSG